MHLAFQHGDAIPQPWASGVVSPRTRVALPCRRPVKRRFHSGHSLVVLDYWFRLVVRARKCCFWLAALGGGRLRRAEQPQFRTDGERVLVRTCFRRRRRRRRRWGLRRLRVMSMSHRTAGHVVEDFRDDPLWHGIRDFQLDAPDARFPFSKRLARENGWTWAFALKVIEEYKRFSYLAPRAGHPVSPSEEVDQAWHLHLLYTHSYWVDFCGLVLGRPFHHGRGRAGRRKAPSIATGIKIPWTPMAACSASRLQPNSGRRRRSDFATWRPIAGSTPRPTG